MDDHQRRASEGGFYKSTDGGEHFTKITDGSPDDLIGKVNSRVTAANPNRVYALVEAKPGGGLYRSDDAGQSWTLMNMQPSAASIARPFYYNTLGADPTKEDVVYGGAENFYKSTDGGKTFTTCARRTATTTTSGSARRTARSMIQSNDGGANVSLDGGRTWSTQNNQPTAEIYGVWMDEQFPYKHLRRAAGRRHGDRAEPRRSRCNPRTVRARPGLRDRPDHAAPEESRHRLRRRARASSAYES